MAHFFSPTMAQHFSDWMCPRKALVAKLRASPLYDNSRPKMNFRTLSSSGSQCLVLLLPKPKHVLELDWMKRIYHISFMHLEKTKKYWSLFYQHLSTTWKHYQQNAYLSYQKLHLLVLHPITACLQKVHCKGWYQLFGEVVVPSANPKSVSAKPA